MRQQKFDKAVSIALESTLLVPSFHIMQCFEFVGNKDDKVVDPQMEKQFCKYMLSLIQYQDKSERLVLILYPYPLPALSLSTALSVQ